MHVLTHQLTDVHPQPFPAPGSGRVQMSQPGAGNHTSLYILSIFHADILLLVFLASTRGNPAHPMLNLKGSEACGSTIGFNSCWIRPLSLSIDPFISYSLFMCVSWDWSGPKSVTFPALGKGSDPSHVLLYDLLCPAGAKCTSLLREIWIWTILRW